MKLIGTSRIPDTGKKFRMYCFFTMALKLKHSYTVYLKSKRVKVLNHMFFGTFVSFSNLR